MARAQNDTSRRYRNIGNIKSGKDSKLNVDLNKSSIFEEKTGDASNSNHNNNPNNNNKRKESNNHNRMLFV